MSGVIRINITETVEKLKKLFKSGDKSKMELITLWARKLDENNYFLVALPNFPGSYWRTHGDTYDQAFANGKEALESLITAYESTGESLPIPKVAYSA